MCWGILIGAIQSESTTSEHRSETQKGYCLGSKDVIHRMLLDIKALSAVP